jgi:nucleotide-binding universal stress UspA family protein
MQRILVGVDGSERAAGVLGAATALARRTGGKLVLVRAVGVPLELPLEAYAMPPTSVVDLLQQEADKGLERLAEAVPAELIEKKRVLVGTPWQAICQAAKDEDVDLVVIGSHGYQGLDRLLGTTAAKVVNHSDVAVLVVRQPERLGL